MIYLSLAELLYVAERTLGQDYALRDYGLLAAAVARPQATAYGKDAYPDLDSKAAALLHSVARNRASIDGNKRLGLTAVMPNLPGPTKPVRLCGRGLRASSALRVPGGSPPLAALTQARRPLGRRLLRLTVRALIDAMLAETASESASAPSTFPA